MFKHSFTAAIALAMVSQTGLANDKFDLDRYDSNFSDLDKSVNCSVQQQEALAAHNQQLQQRTELLENQLANLQGKLSELRKQSNQAKGLSRSQAQLQQENQRLEDELTDLRNTTDQYLLVCNDFKNRLDKTTELNTVLKDNLALKEQRIAQLQQAGATPADCPATSVVAPVAVPDCSAPTTTYREQPIAGIAAHGMLTLDGVYALHNDKRADAILAIRKFLPMPLDKATYMKLVGEGFSDDKWNWDERAEAAKHLTRFRPRDLTAQDIKTLLASSSNNKRNDILQHLLAGAQYPLTFDGALSLVSGYYDQTDYAQDRKAEAIQMLSFYLPRQLTSDQVFKLVTGLTGKARSNALSSLTSKIRTDFTHDQKQRLLDGFYSQTDAGKKHWSRGYDALSPEKRRFIF
jgi:TolA-binding protein